MSATGTAGTTAATAKQRYAQLDKEFAEKTKLLAEQFKELDTLSRVLEDMPSSIPSSFPGQPSKKKQLILAGIVINKITLNKARGEARKILKQRLPELYAQKTVAKKRGPSTTQNMSQPGIIDPVAYDFFTKPSVREVIGRVNRAPGTPLDDVNNPYIVDKMFMKTINPDNGLPCRVISQGVLTDLFNIYYHSTNMDENSGYNRQFPANDSRRSTKYLGATQDLIDSFRGLVEEIHNNQRATQQKNGHTIGAFTEKGQQRRDKAQNALLEYQQKLAQYQANPAGKAMPVPPKPYAERPDDRHRLFDLNNMLYIEFNVIISRIFKRWNPTAPIPSLTAFQIESINPSNTPAAVITAYQHLVAEARAIQAENAKQNAGIDISGINYDELAQVATLFTPGSRVAAELDAAVAQPRIVTNTPYTAAVQAIVSREGQGILAQVQASTYLRVRARMNVDDQTVTRARDSDPRIKERRDGPAKGVSKTITNLPAQLQSLQSKINDILGEAKAK